MAMSPTQRPVGVLGFWASLMTALGNTENMPVSNPCLFKIHSKFSVPVPLGNLNLKLCMNMY